MSPAPDADPGVGGPPAVTAGAGILLALTADQARDCAELIAGPG